MLAIHFVISIGGILFCLQTARTFRMRGLVNQKSILLVTAIAVALGMTLPNWFTIASHVRGPLALLIFAAPAALYPLLEKAQVETFRQKLPQFLDRWLLNLRLGHSAISCMPRQMQPTVKAKVSFGSTRRKITAHAWLI